MTSTLLECELPAANAGGSKQVLLLERDLYNNAEDEFYVTYRQATFVYEISPRSAFKRAKTEVLVYVSHQPQIYTAVENYQYCQFGDKTVRAHSVEAIMAESETSPIVTNTTVIKCYLPYFAAAETVEVEILNEKGEFTSSINNEFNVLEPVSVSSIDTPLYPLDFTIPTFTITGSDFDANYDYFC